MDSMQKNNICEIFEREKENAAEKMAGIYQQIARVVMAQPPERIVQTILQEESQRINDYIRSLRQDLKEKACRAMVSFGFTEAVTDIIWANTMTCVSLPKVFLCQKQDVKIPVSGNKRPAGPDPRQRAQLRRLGTAKKAAVGAAAAGTVAEIITCLVVPGWTGVVGAAKVAGLVVIGAGAAGAAASQYQIQEINRIVNQVQNSESSRTDTRQVIKEICRYQCDANRKIICQWLDRVCEELILQCEMEQAR